MVKTIGKVSSLSYLVLVRHSIELVWNNFNVEKVLKSLINASLNNKSRK